MAIPKHPASPWLAIPEILGHSASLHPDQLNKSHQLIDFQFPLACACYSNEICSAPKGHVAKCKLHDSIPAIDDCMAVAINGLPRIIGT